MLTFAAAVLCAAACYRFPKGEIEGTVHDRSGAPIAGVGVYVAGLAHTGASDASGRYRLAKVPVGTHRLRATAVGYAPQERDSVVVREGATTIVDFTLDRMWPGLVLPSTPGSGGATILAARSTNWKPVACHSSVAREATAGSSRTPARPRAVVMTPGPPATWSAVSVTASEAGLKHH